MTKKVKESKKQTKNFSMYQIITKKRDGKPLDQQEISWVVKELTAGNIPDYQMASLLMAIYLKGFSVAETAALTDAMRDSGSVLDFKDKKVIDKHSTGGIGDKTSFILAPIAAACGVKVPMIAGRALGHTGGTVDKIESVAGFKTSLTMEEFKEGVTKHGLVLMGQTGEIAPADKKIYALRDVTATVESIPLITASIMSKKLAEGTSGLVLDVKTGQGAFMKTLPQAQALAKSIRDTAHRCKKNIMTMITDMNQPLGMTIGNTIEITESIDTLRGKGPKDLTDLCLELAGGMVYLAGLSKTHKEGIKKAQAALDSGAALEKFRELITRQGGDARIVDDYSLLPHAKEVTEIKAPKAGFLSYVDIELIGLLLVELGGGRKKASDQIDFGVGFTLTKKAGDKVKKGEAIAIIHHHAHQVEIVKFVKDEYLKKAVIIKDKKSPAKPLVYETKTIWSK